MVTEFVKQKKGVKGRRRSVNKFRRDKRLEVKNWWWG